MPLVSRNDGSRLAPRYKIAENVNCAATQGAIVVASSMIGLRTGTAEEVQRPTSLENSRTPVIFAESDKVSRQRVMDLYAELHPALLAHLRVLGLSKEDAEDVIHESFLRLVQHLLKARADENVKGWVFRVAYNLCMDVHRAQKHYRYASHEEPEDQPMRRCEAIDPSPGPEAVLIEKQTFQNLQAAVLQLTMQQRKCLLLRSEGLRYREIASTLGISAQRAARLLQLGTSHVVAKL